VVTWQDVEVHNDAPGSRTGAWTDPVTGGSTSRRTFLRGVAGFLTTKHYNYDYTKDTSSSATLNKLVTATVTAVAYQIGKNTKYMTSGVTV